LAARSRWSAAISFCATLIIRSSKNLDSGDYAFGYNAQTREVKGMGEEQRLSLNSGQRIDTRTGNSGVATRHAVPLTLKKFHLPELGLVDLCRYHFFRSLRLDKCVLRSYEC
jgi:hypothetical protein